MSYADNYLETKLSLAADYLNEVRINGYSKCSSEFQIIVVISHNKRVPRDDRSYAHHEKHKPGVLNKR